MSNAPEYRLCSTIHWCVQNKAPQYLVDCCTPTSAASVISQLPPAVSTMTPMFHVWSLGRLWRPRTCY